MKAVEVDFSQDIGDNKDASESGEEAAGFVDKDTAESAEAQKNDSKRTKNRVEVPGSTESHDAQTAGGHIDRKTEPAQVKVVEEK